MRLSVRRPGALVLMAALALGLRAAVARAQDSAPVRIGLTYAGGKPSVLVLPVNGPLGDSVRAILQRDLDYGDRVTVIGTESVVMDSASDGSRGQFNYPLYSRVGAAAMIQATLTETGLHVAVHDVSRQRVERVRDFALTAPPLSPAWRQQVHQASDAIEVWLTGSQGIAASRILYSSGGRIWQIDSDGANPTPLTPASPPALYPAWHPKASHIAYAVQTDDGTRIVIREMGSAGNASRTLTAPRGSVNTSPAFSQPDGETLLYAHGQESGTDIFAVPTFGHESPRRVTVSRGLDAVSPTVSPDGRRIVYVTNKSGGLALYIADADGTNAEVLAGGSFGDRLQRTDPSWSPDGRTIAFQAEMDGNTQIYTVGIRDLRIRQFTNQGRNEDPSWAPDSRHVVFTSNRSGSWQLWVLDTESNRVRQLTHAAAGAKAGAWSPRLTVP